MIKKITKFILKVAAVLALVLALLVALLYYRQDDIKALALAGINENLNAPISVGAIELSLAKFPQAAIKLEDVFSTGAQGFKDTLFNLESVYLQFDIWQILGGSIKIDKISLEEGRLFLEKYGAKQNWDIFRNNDSASRSALSLEGIFLKNISFDYRDRYKKVNFKSYLNSAFFEGGLASDKLELRGKLNTLINYLEIEKEVYTKIPISLQTDWTWQDLGENQELKLTHAYLAEELLLNLVLNLSTKGLELSVTANNLDVASVLQIYQERDFALPEGFNSSGKVQLNYQLQNFKNQAISQSVTFSSDDLKIVQGRFNFDHLAVKGSYRSQGSSNFLDIATLKSEDESFTISGSLKNLQHPEVNMHLQANMSAARWQELFPFDSLKISNGSAWADLQISGRFKNLSDWTAAEVKSAQIEGFLQFEKLAISSSTLAHNLEDVSGRLSAQGNDIHIDKLSVSSGGSDLLINGSLSNLWSYLLSENEILGIRGNLLSDHIALEDFISEKEETTASAGNIEFARRLQADLRLQLKAFSYQNFSAKMLQGRLIISENLIKGEDISLLADAGSYNGAFTLNLSSREQYQLSAQLQTQNLEVKSLFKSFKNFRQETLTSDELEGRLSSQSSFSVLLAPDLSFDALSLKLSSSMTIDEGRLKDYGPMLALSRFAEVDELKDVRFNKLTNTISIEEGLILIPEMTISSNVLNLDLSGSHSFENEIDYLIKLRLGDVLFSKRKAKAKDSEFDAFLSIEKRDDDHRIPISILGTVDNPSLKVEVMELGKALQTDLNRQKEELKKIFKKEAEKKSGTGLQFEWEEDDDI